jgi:hypothetical protein
MEIEEIEENDALKLHELPDDLLNKHLAATWDFIMESVDA